MFDFWVMKASFFLPIILYASLSGFTQEKPYSIIINEILADPSPIVALPNCEFIELRNCSNENINLNKWKLSIGNTTATIGTNYNLQHDSLVILCAKSNVVFFNSYNNIIGLTSFPTLGNEEDIIMDSFKLVKI